MWVLLNARYRVRHFRRTNNRSLIAAKWTKRTLVDTRSMIDLPP